MTRISFPGMRRAAPAAAGALALAPALLLLSCGGDDPASPAQPHAPTVSVGGGLSVTEEGTEVVAVTATDPDLDAVTLSARGLPAFAAFADLGDGTAELTLAPRLGQAGSYPGVVLRASDGELADSVTVTLVVTPLARVSGALFYEPPAFCLGQGENRDSLVVYNPTASTLHWRALRVPAGLTGLEGLVTLDPQSFAATEWVWDPPGPFPVADTLILATNNATFSTITIPFRREDPAGAVDFMPPPAPLLFLPEEGAVFTASLGAPASIDVVWSELDDCSGIAHYRLEISRSPQFTNVVCCPEDIPHSAATVEAFARDAGTAYWRVYAVDGSGLRGPNSEVRSWTVVTQ